MIQAISNSQAKRSTEGASNQKNTDFVFGRWEHQEDGSVILYLSWHAVDTQAGSPKAGFKLEGPHASPEMIEHIITEHAYDPTKSEYDDTPQDLLDAEATANNNDGVRHIFA